MDKLIAYYVFCGLIGWLLGEYSKKNKTPMWKMIPLLLGLPSVLYLILFVGDK